MAVQFLALSIVSWQVVFVPHEAQSTVHPPNVEGEVGVAVRVTGDVVKLNVQVPPQLMPAGELVTAPVPVPASVMLSGASTAMAVDVAVTAHDPEPTDAIMLPDPGLVAVTWNVNGLEVEGITTVAGVAVTPA